MSDIHFYSGYVKTDINEPFVFEVEELEIEKVFKDGTIKLHNKVSQRAFEKFKGLLEEGADK